MTSVSNNTYSVASLIQRDINNQCLSIPVTVVHPPMRTKSLRRQRPETCRMRNECIRPSSFVILSVISILSSWSVDLSVTSLTTYIKKNCCPSMAEHSRRPSSKNLLFASSLVSSISESNQDENPSRRRTRQQSFLYPSSSVKLTESEQKVHYLKKQYTEFLKRSSFEKALDCIYEMYNFIAITTSQSNASQQADNPTQHNEWCRIFDSMIQTYTSYAFAPPYDGNSPATRNRIFCGVDAIYLQLSNSASISPPEAIINDDYPTRNSNNERSVTCECLLPPYNTVTKRTLLDALKALTALNGEKSYFNNKRNRYNNYIDYDTRASDEAFRVLQRLVTGVGVRQIDDENNKVRATNQVSKTVSVPTQQQQPWKMEEQDFNRVLNSFSNTGRMEMVHRVLALQERTLHAPPLSPVSYSILIKGYGRLRDRRNIDWVINHAIQNNIVPDTVLLNTLIDAYINCNAFTKAQEVFEMMKYGDRKRQNGIDSNNDLANVTAWLMEQQQCPKPNRRTYNTILKGFANFGMLTETFKLADEMKQLRLWDSVTTNTMVHASIKASDLDLAESILQNNTVTKWDTLQKSQHPNVEAYTELLDAYAKSNMLTKAIATLQTMQQRGVKPNAITYTCLLGGLGRENKIIQARKTLQYMNDTNMVITTKPFNALISGLVISPNAMATTSTWSATASTKDWVTTLDDELNGRVDEALKLLRDMIQFNIRPNDVTLSVLIDAFGRCNPPRIKEAMVLVDNFERQQYVARRNTKVATALIQICGKVGDDSGAIKAFRTIGQPDTIAVNTLLDALSRNGKDDIAKQFFYEFFISSKQNKRFTQDLKPDVVSYSIMIGEFLRQATTRSIRSAQSMYNEMRSVWNILPDNALVDVILKAMIRNSNQGMVFDKNSAIFIAAVLNDAEMYLEWGEGELERRKRAIYERCRGFLPKKDTLEGLSAASNKSADDLFQRKGWNQVDSGFRLWGGGKQELENTNNQKKNANRKIKNPKIDSFLASHGWNDVNSGFRII